MGVLQIERLTPFERGFVLGMLLGGERAGLKGRVVEPTETRCCAAAEQLAAAERRTRLLALQRLTRDAVQTWPEALEQVHPSWIDALLERQPSMSRLLVISTLPRALADAITEDGAIPPRDVRRVGTIPLGLRQRLAVELLGELRAPLQTSLPEDAARLWAWPSGRYEAALGGLAALALVELGRRARDLDELAHAAWLQAASDLIDHAHQDGSPAVELPWSWLVGAWPRAIKASTPSARCSGKNSTPSARCSGKNSMPSARCSGRTSTPSARCSGKNSTPSARCSGQNSTPSARCSGRHSMLVGLGFHLIAGDLPATVCLRLALKLPRELVASASACERPADGVADQAREALRLVLAVDHGLRHARGEGAP